MACEECLRRVYAGRQNRILRRTIEDFQSRMDQAFFALCEDKASVAMGELWGSGEFDCGPEDYDYIVERCLEAMSEYNESRTHPAPA